MLKGEYIAHIKHLPKIETIQNHLENIENYIDQKQFIVLSQIASAHYSSAIVTNYNRTCIDYIDILLSITHTNDKNYTAYFNTFYSELYSHNNPIIKSIVIFIGGLKQKFYNEVQHREI